MSVPSPFFFALNADDAVVPRHAAVFGWRFNAWGPPGFWMIDTGVGRRARRGRCSMAQLIEGERMTGFECTIAVPKRAGAGQRSSPMARS
jgi:hypothetical protein